MMANLWRGMNTPAILFDDRALYEPSRLYLLCVYCPVLVVSVAALLIQWNRKLGVLALFIAAVAAVAILLELRSEDTRAELRHQMNPASERMDGVYARASWFAAAFPVVVVVILVVSGARKSQESPGTLGDREC